MSIVLLGSTSGSCQLQEQAEAGTTTLTLPTFNGTVGLLVSGTAVASTSGTSIDFTSIPAGVRRITVMFNGVSTNGSSTVQIQIGSASGGIESSSYNVQAQNSNNASIGFNSGFAIENTGGSAWLRGGLATIANVSENIWAFSSVIGSTGQNITFAAGYKSISSTLNQIRITTVNGTDTFDAGSINILYE